MILLPPSEGKAAGGEGPPWESVDQSFPTLADPRREVVNALVEAMGGSPEARFKLLGVKAAKAEEPAAADAKDAPSSPKAEAAKKAAEPIKEEHLDAKSAESDAHDKEAAAKIY